MSGNTADTGARQFDAAESDTVDAAESDAVDAAVSGSGTTRDRPDTNPTTRTRARSSTRCSDSDVRVGGECRVTAVNHGVTKGDATGTWPRRLLDLGQYAVALVVLAVAVSIPPSLYVGLGLRGIKIGLFVVGFASFSYATYLLQPSSPDDDSDRTARAVRDRTPLERRLDRVPPLCWYPVRPDAPLSRGAKLFVASLLTLAVCWSMEALLGIGP